MRCPYCGINFSLDGVDADHSYPKFGGAHLYGPGLPRNPNDKEFTITSHKCPECKRQVMWLKELGKKGQDGNWEVRKTTLLYPKQETLQVDGNIPHKYASILKQAHAVLEISPMASAALSRRCLQELIREKEGITRATLYEEIKELLSKNKLPVYLAKDLDAIRAVGNFAGHPIKDTTTGMIVEVEPGEAEWTLELLMEMLEFYFVELSRSNSRREALNKKLSAANKPPILGDETF